VATFALGLAWCLLGIPSDTPNYCSWQVYNLQPLATGWTPPHPVSTGGPPLIITPIRLSGLFDSLFPVDYGWPSYV